MKKHTDEAFAVTVLKGNMQPMHVVYVSNNVGVALCRAVGRPLVIPANLWDKASMRRRLLPNRGTVCPDCTKVLHDDVALKSRILEIRLDKQ